MTSATSDLLGILPDNYCTAYAAAESYEWRASVVGEEDNPLLLGGRARLSLKVRSRDACRGMCREPLKGGPQVV